MLKRLNNIEELWRAGMAKALQRTFPHLSTMEPGVIEQRQGLGLIATLATQFIILHHSATLPRQRLSWTLRSQA